MVLHNLHGAYGKLRTATAIYELFERKTIVGREQKYCDICLDSRGISRKHATIEFPEGSLTSYALPTITDHESSNGTFVNGNRLSPHKATELHNGDIIYFSGYEKTSYRLELPGHDSLPPMESSPPPAKQKLFLGAGGVAAADETNPSTSNNDYSSNVIEESRPTESRNTNTDYTTRESSSKQDRFTPQPVPREDSQSTYSRGRSESQPLSGNQNPVCSQSPGDQSNVRPLPTFGNDDYNQINNRASPSVEVDSLAAPTPNPKNVEIKSNERGSAAPTPIFDESVMKELEQERALRKELQAKLDRFENIEGIEGDSVLALKNEVSNQDTQLVELRLQLTDYEKWFALEDKKKLSELEDKEKDMELEDKEKDLELEDKEAALQIQDGTISEELVPWVSKVAGGLSSTEGKELSDILMRVSTAVNFQAQREAEATRRWNTLQQENKYLKDQVRTVRSAVKKYKVRTHEVELAADKRVKLMLAKVAAIENPVDASYEEASKVLADKENEKADEQNVEKKDEVEGEQAEGGEEKKEDDDVPSVEGDIKKEASKVPSVSEQGTTNSNHNLTTTKQFSNAC